MVAKRKKVVKKVAKKVIAKRTSSRPTKKAVQPKPFYVGVPSPSERRRLLLESTADFLKLLKYVELHRQKRAEKKLLLQKFHKVMQEVRESVTKIHKLLPKYALPHAHSQVAHEVAKPTEVVASKPKPKAQTEVEALESELATIERKLKGL